MLFLELVACAATTALVSVGSINLTMSFPWPGPWCQKEIGGRGCIIGGPCISDKTLPGGRNPGLLGLLVGRLLYNSFWYQ